jgi:hypothetical protein
LRGDASSEDGLGGLFGRIGAKFGVTLMDLLRSKSGAQAGAPSAR